MTTENAKKCSFSKKQTTLMPTFCQKKLPFSQKYSALMSFFSKSFHDKHATVIPMFGRKRQFCKNYTILWAPRVNRMPFFPIFHEKIIALIPIFRQKNVNSLKSTLTSCPNFVKKTSISSKNCAIMSLFSKFSQQIHCSCARIWSKNVNSVKATPIYGPKKSINCPFFRFFTTKSALMLIFC